MSFLTQQDFFKSQCDVATNLREPNQPPTSIKAYESCFDPRAWSFRKLISSQFLLDEVHRLEQDDYGGCGDGMYTKTSNTARPIRSRSNVEVHRNLESGPCLQSDVLRSDGEAVSSEQWAQQNAEIDFLKQKLVAAQEEANRSKCENANLREEANVAKCAYAESERQLSCLKELDNSKSLSSHKPHQLSCLKEDIDTSKRLSSHKPHSIDSHQRDQKQLEECIKERNRLREQLDKMTSIEGKLGEMKAKADRCSMLERERDQLRDHCAKLGSEQTRMQKEQVASNEALRKASQQNMELSQKITDYQGSVQQLSKRNSELAQKTNEFRNSIDELSRKSSINDSILSKTLGKDMANTKMQLSVAEAAIKEYEKTICQHIDTITELNKQLDFCKQDKKKDRNRLQSLDHLELEVDELQSQLSNALQHQRAQPMADLLAAVKLTLLYVQNKLTSRETMGNEAELDRLKAELLNLRDRRESVALEQSRSEIERLKKQVNQASREKLSQEEIQKCVENMVADCVKSLRTEIGDLRKQLSDAHESLNECTVHAQNSIDSMQTGIAKELENSKSIICGQKETIQDLQEHIEQSCRRQSNVEQDMASQVEELEQENVGLREHISILNGQMDELGCLIDEIESEREKNKGLQEELQKYDDTLQKIPSDNECTPPERNTMSDALNVVTDQLEQENRRSQHLSQENADLRKQIVSSEERVERLASQVSELELTQGTTDDLATQIGELNKVNGHLNKQLSDFRKSLGIVDTNENAAKTTNMTNDSMISVKKDKKSLDDLSGQGDNFTRSTCLCTWETVKITESEKNQLLEEKTQQKLLRQLCRQILEQGIKSLNLRQLSQLHHLIYLAGIRYLDEIRQRAVGHPGIDSVRQRQLFYRNKEKEHIHKVEELQQQLVEIQQYMLKIRRAKIGTKTNINSSQSKKGKPRRKNGAKFKSVSNKSTTYRSQSSGSDRNNKTRCQSMD